MLKLLDIVIAKKKESMMGRKHKPAFSIDYNQPYSLRVMLERFLQWLRVHNYAETTVIYKQECLIRFIDWSEERAKLTVGEVTRIDLQRYQRGLWSYRKADGAALSVETQSNHLSTIRIFFRWLSKQGYIDANPASELELPKKGQRLPSAILTQAEVETILQMPNLETRHGLRDRAILETFYSTGIRRAELVKLRMRDLDRERGMLVIRAGKGNKDRIVPIGDRALAWIDKYIAQSRPELINGEMEAVLFVNKYAKPWHVAGLGHMVHRYVRQAGIDKQGACHLFRHTMATLMLEAGADIRYIQQMLGHKDLAATQIYTRVTDHKLKQVHTRTHPAAKLERGQNLPDNKRED
jgi:integrase/recombinase XerD